MSTPVADTLPTDMNTEVTIETGTLRGVRERDVLHFRGIPYARAARFQAPLPAAAWSGVREAGQHGPACPQPKSPFDAILGRAMAQTAQTAQDEHCLTLSVSTPRTVQSQRPVMVWIHGGAYVWGAGSSAGYHGGVLVAEGDVVLVSINYRLGAFGYLQAPGVTEGNLGVLDQLAALHWVQRNIAAFGGDPTRVTVFGESAGGHSILALMSTPLSLGLFQRAIVQSAQIGLGFTRPSAAQRVARALVRALPSQSPLTASTEELLTAQQAAMLAFEGKLRLNSAPAFGPVAGVAPLAAAADIITTPSQTRPDVALLIGANRDEARFFTAVHPVWSRLRRVPWLGSLVELIGAAFTRQIFVRPAYALASAHAAAGADVYTYRFVWTPRAPAFGICHALELPFVFGAPVWHDAPMLGGSPWEDVERLGREMRAAWTSFAHHGDPTVSSGTAWPKHQPGASAGRSFS